MDALTPSLSRYARRTAPQHATITSPPTAWEGGWVASPPSGGLAQWLSNPSGAVYLSSYSPIPSYSEGAIGFVKFDELALPESIASARLRLVMDVFGQAEVSAWRPQAWTELSTDNPALRTLEGPATSMWFGKCWGVTMSPPALEVVVDVTDLVKGWRSGAIPNDGVCLVYYPSAASTSGSSATVTLEVFSEGGGGGDHPPTVEIVNPEDGDEVTGVVPVIAEIEDSGDDVQFATCSVDGQVIGTLTGPNAGAQWRWEWDTRGWSNSPHVVRVTAYDVIDSASDEVALTPANSLADARKILVTYLRELPESATTETVLRLFESIKFCPETGDPTSDFNVQVYYRSTDDGEDHSSDPNDYVTVDRPGRRTHVPVSPGTWFQWLFVADPQVWVLDDLDSLEDTIIDACASQTPGLYYLLACNVENPDDPAIPVIYAFDGTTFQVAATLPPLPHETSALPTCVEAIGSLVLVGQGSYLRAYDLDAGQVVLDVVIGQEEEATESWQVRDLARESSTAVLVAAYKAAAEKAAVFRFEWEATTKVGEVEEAGTSSKVATLPTPLFGHAGKVYSVGASALTEAFDTGEAEVTHLGAADAEAMAGTGVSGKLFGSLPAWGEELDLDDPGVLGSAFAFGDAFAIGASPVLWRRAAATGLWASYRDLSESFVEMRGAATYVFADADLGSGILLWGRSSEDPATGRCMLLRASPLTGSPNVLACGPEPPIEVLGAAESERSE